MIKVTRYTAGWCGPCRTLAPIMVKVQEHFQGKPVTFEIVDIDLRKDLAEEAGVRSIPTVKIDSSTDSQTVLGAQNFNTYVQAIERLL